MASINVFLYWGARKMPLSEASTLVIEHFNVLREIGPPFAEWVQSATSRKRALSNPLIDVRSGEAITKLLIKGQNKTDTYPRTPIPELGYHVLLWNKLSHGLDVTTSIRCGVHSEFLSIDSQNMVSLVVRADNETRFQGIDPDDILHKLANIWSAQSGTASIVANGVERTVASI